tara:strand:- start:2772 stop:3176 length:405 start_codon:yes stop_codon:yes gene_type:complete
MARRRKKTTRRRSPKTFKIINAIEAYAYANLLTQGIAGTGPVNFLTGGSDISMDYSNGSLQVTGTDQLSLSEIVTNPGAAFSGMQMNFMQNYQNMAVQAVTISVGFRLAKRLLRKPISTVNRELIKPLGIGVAL